MKRFTKTWAAAGILLTAALVGGCSGLGLSGVGKSSPRTAATPAPSLGLASTFAVFGGGAGFTNAGLLTEVRGDAGTTGASTMVTGFHSASFVYSETPLNRGAISGSVFTAAPQGSAADFAHVTAVASDLLATFNDLAGRVGTDPGTGELGGLTLIPGVYRSAAGPFLITGKDLTLDAQGDPEAVWIFQAASTLLVGNATTSQSVILTNGAQAKNVFWQVGSAATINPAGGGTMVGTIIASAGITFSTAGNVTPTVLNGRALGLFASVTMVNTVVNALDTPYVATPIAQSTLAASDSHIVVTGSTAADVTPVVSGGGYITVANEGAHVAATQTGLGTIHIQNSGGVLTATNTGTGIMTIVSNATGAVTVTNTGTGRVTVNATGAAAIAIVHSGASDYVYP